MRRVALTVVSLLGLALFPVPASAGVCTDTVVVDDAAYTPAVKLAPVQNGSFMCWTNEGTVTHTATSDTGMFDTNGIAPAGSAGVDILGSGSYPYHCNLHPGIQGSLKIRPVADAASITLGDSFELTVGNLFSKGIPWDVQKKYRDGEWRTFVTQTFDATLTLTPGKAGTFRYRARTWIGENHSGWSPPRKVVVDPA